MLLSTKFGNNIAFEYLYIIIKFIGHFSFYRNVLQNTQKKEKRKKKTTTLIYCISDERYNLEDLLKSDMD